MSTFSFKIHGRNVKFKAASLMQARFARDRHIEALRESARKRASTRRIGQALEEGQLTDEAFDRLYG